MSREQTEIILKAMSKPAKQDSSRTGKRETVNFIEGF